jgi:hypothetical protein
MLKKKHVNFLKTFLSNLTYYSSLDKNKQRQLGELIITDIERYKALVDVVMDYDEELAKTETRTFTSFLQLFDHFNEGNSREDFKEPTEDIDINQQDTVIVPE